MKISTLRLRIWAILPLVISLAGCGPDTKEEFWLRFNALLDEEQGRSKAVFQRSPERRAEVMDDFVTDYYDEFGPMMTTDEKAEFFGKVAVFYLIRSGVLTPASDGKVAPAANDSLARTANDALQSLGKLFQALGETLTDSAQLDSLGRKIEQDVPKHLQAVSDSLENAAARMRKAQKGQPQ